MPSGGARFIYFTPRIGGAKLTYFTPRIGGARMGNPAVSTALIP